MCTRKRGSQKRTERIHEKYIFVPTDKAKNNVPLACKKFYVQPLHDEISSNTYQLSTESDADIINRHSDFLKEHGIKLKSGNKKLPYLHSTVNLHKDPIKFILIRAGSNKSL